MRLGSEEPRVFTPPLRELTPETSAGFSIIDFADEVLGVRLLPWQRFFCVHAFELEEGGGFRFRTVILLVARQNGKSTLAQVISLWALYVLGVQLVIGTAQTLDVSEETWAGAVSMAQGVPELDAEIDRVVMTNGKKSLDLVGGHRYKVAAASRKGGRSLTGDLILLDELREHLNWEAWAAVTKTTMARPDAVVLGLSNAGDSFSVVLRHLRFVAHLALGDPDGWCAATGDSTAGLPEGADVDSVGIFEWSATPGCDMSDRDEWARANPSLGYTVTEKAVAAALATDVEAKFRTEVLCQWVETIRPEPFPEGSWDAGKDPTSRVPDEEPVCYGVDVSADGTKTSIAACGRRADGLWHVEVVARRVGTDWAVRWLAERGTERDPIRVAAQGRGAPVSAALEDMESVPAIDVHRCEGRELAAWCGRIWRAVAASSPDEGGLSDATRVMHRPQEVLDVAAKVAATSPMGDGAWAWSRRTSPEDIAPLVACTMAFGLASTPAEPGRESVYELHDLIVI